MKLTMTLCLLVAGLAAGQTISSQVVTPRAGKTASVIVQYRQTDPDAFNAKARSLGRAVKQIHAEVGILSMDATAQDLEALASDPNVEYVTPDRAVQPTQTSVKLGTQSGIEFARRAANTQQLLNSGFSGSSRNSKASFGICFCFCGGAFYCDRCIGNRTAGFISNRAFYLPLLG